MVLRAFSSRLVFITFAQICGLTVLLSLSLLADLHHGRKSARTLAETTARTSAVESLLYRELLVATGGAYLPVEGLNIPDPALARRSDRDLLTADGRRYTLITPPRLLTLIHGGDSRKSPIQASLKTFQPLGLADTPDSWESQALAALRQGRPEVSALVSVEGKSYLRFMYPVSATEGCLKNRPGQGLKVGDLLGGFSLLLPMTVFDEVWQEHTRIAFLLHGILWLLGLAGIFWSFTRMRQRDAVIIQAGVEVKEAYGELRQIFEGSTIGMLKLSPTGEILRANRAFSSISGVASEAVICRPFWETLMTDEAECAKDAMAQVLRGALSVVCEMTITGPGDQRFYQCSVAPLGETAGKPTGVLVSFHDLTGRRLAEARTLEAKEELEKTFDAFGDIITVQDQEMRITRINRAGCTLFGAREEELVGKYCYELFRGTSTPCPHCPELDALQDGKLHQAEMVHESLGRVFFVTASPLLDKAGKVVRIVHLARDITENKRMERQLHQGQKMEAIGTLAGGIAHDFNNILAGVIGFSELAMLEVPAESPVHADLAEILRAGLRAKELVKQILTFSRRTEQNVQPLLVQPIVKESLKLLRASLPTMIELRQKIAEECGMVLADPTQIHQVVMNLCTNAYQSMRGRGGVLGVAMAPVELGQADVANKMALKPGNYVRLSISDTGSGIAPEILEHIFEPYFTTKKKGEGTGLGLSVVHGIVQGLGGHVSVYSEPGQGTTFHVYLPVLPSQTDIPPVGAVTEAQIPTGTERVLLLDDEKGVVATEQRILTGLGYTVRGFTSCTEAMDEFLRHSDAYDLIITDMNMPKISGAELAEAVRAVRPDIPIIMCTGFSEIMNEEKARQLGINRLIMKPLTLKELAQNVRGVLDAAR
jgi:PAS domain S-box-containing protein